LTYNIQIFIYKISDATTKDPTAWREEGKHCIMSPHSMVSSKKVMKDQVIKTVTCSGNFNAKTKVRKEAA
jgi:hypothetical protein